MSQPENAPGAKASEMDRSVFKNLAILVLSATIMILNETSLSVALKAIMGDFDIPATTAQWLITGFMLTMAVVIPTTGYLIERFSTRQIFLAATALFIFGSVIAAVAPLFAILFLGRVIQAAGTALIIPLLITVTMFLVPLQRRGTVMGFITVVVSVAPALGPTVGGAILDAFNWNVIFWAMVPLMALIALWGWWKLDNVGENRDTPLDILSVFFAAIAFGGLIYGLSGAEKIMAGEGILEVIIVVVAVVILFVFVRRQLALGKENRALLDLQPFKVRNFTFAIIIMVLCFGSMIGAFTILPIYLQTSLAVTPLVTGLVVMPGGLAQGLLSPFIGRIFDSVGPRPLTIPGAIMVSGGMWALSTLDENSSVMTVVFMHVVFVIGIALLMTPLMTTALSSLPDEYYGHGSAIMNTLQQLAGAIGTAFLVVFFTRGTESGLAAGMSEASATSQGTSWAFILGGILTLAVVVLAPFVTRIAESVDHSSQPV